MAIGRATTIAVLALAAAICGLFLLAYSSASDDNSATCDRFRVDWAQKAHDIAMLNQTFTGLTGDKQQRVSGIVWEESHAYMYYRVDGRIYNVSVDFRNETVTSIDEVKDEKTLGWLENVSAFVTAKTLPTA